MVVNCNKMKPESVGKEDMDEYFRQAVTAFTIRMHSGHVLDPPRRN